MSAIAFDSKEYHSQIANFYEPIGLGIETLDLDAFKQAYDGALNLACARWSVPRRRKAFSYETLKLIYPSNAEAIVSKVLSAVSPYINHVWFFHSRVNAIKTPLIFSRGKYRSLPPLDFMRINQQSYPYWCAWRLSQEVDIAGDRILLDAFQGEETVAWTELNTLRPEVVYKGDEVNPLVSTADILLARADRQLRNGVLNDASVSKAFSELGFNASVLFIGQPHYRKITAVSRNSIDYRANLTRPLVFILHDSRPKEITPRDWERTRFIAPTSDRPASHAFDLGGGLKAFDYGQDGGLLDLSRDLFYSYGPNGQDRLNKLSNLYGIPSASLYLV